MWSHKASLLSPLGSRGQALSASSLGWVWTEADHLELNGYVAQDKHNDQDYGDQDYAARVLQAKSRHCDRSDDPQARRQQLDSRFLNAFPSWNSAPGCRISYRCDGTIMFSSTASRSITDVEPYTPSARAIR